MPFTTVRLVLPLVFLAALLSPLNAKVEYPYPELTGDIDLTREAIVVFRSAKVDDDGDFGFLKTYMQKENTNQIQYYMYPHDGDTSLPILNRLLPGRYKFIMLTGRILSEPNEPVPVSAYDPDNGVPLTPIEVKAGDIIYVGNLLAHEIGRSSLVGRIPSRSDIRLEVLNNTEKARAQLRRFYPGTDYADRMEVKLIEIVE